MIEWLSGLLPSFRSADAGVLPQARTKSSFENTSDAGNLRLLLSPYDFLTKSN